MNEEQKIRMDCLELAIKRNSINRAASIVDTARKYFDFVAGENDAEIVRAAKDLSKKISSLE